MTNKANVVGVKVPQITVDGACLKATLDNLKEGGAAKPMPEDALVKVRADAIGLLEKVVTVYTGEVAPGEVGASASHRASPKPPSKRAPTGLLYGRVQSGKTVAMITFAAAAIDNGFKVIVVLTSDNVKLVSQTAERFAALDGALRARTRCVETTRPENASRSTSSGGHRAPWRRPCCVFERGSEGGRAVALRSAKAGRHLRTDQGGRSCGRRGSRDSRRSRCADEGA